MKAEVKVCGKSIGEFDVGQDTFGWLKDNVEFVVSSTKPTVKDIVAGLPEIMEDFIRDNKAVVEKYQSGIKSLLDVLAEKAAKKVGETDISKVKTALEDFLRPKSQKPSEDQRHKVIHLLGNIFDHDKLTKIFDRYVAGDVKVLINVASAIRKVYGAIDQEALVEILKEFFEEHRTEQNDKKA